MKYKGSTLNIVVTVPGNVNRMAQVQRLIRHALPGYECSLTHNKLQNNSNSVLSKKKKLKKDSEVALIHSIALNLQVLKKTRETNILVPRTVLVYFLSKHFSSTTIAEAFSWDHTNVLACVKRYNLLKHYPDYQEVSVKVIRLLESYSFDT